MSCNRDFWDELDPEADHQGHDERVADDHVGEPEEFRRVWEELGELGDRVDLAEHAGRWMRLADHAAQLRTSCLEYGLGERLTQRIVSDFIGTFAPRTEQEL